MKRNLIVISVITAFASLMLSACGQKEESAPVPAATEKAGGEAREAASAVGDAVKAAATETREAADKVAADVKKTAEGAGAEASKQAQTLIDQAKALLNEKNYKGATDLFQQLKGLKLTPEQQKLVDDLMAQARKYMASDATKSVEGVLGGKK